VLPNNIQFNKIWRKNSSSYHTVAMKTFQFEATLSRVDSFKIRQVSLFSTVIYKSNQGIILQ
jgi:hypothetical protein